MGISTATGRRSDALAGGWSPPPIRAATPKSVSDALVEWEGLEVRLRGASETLDAIRSEEQAKKAEHERKAVEAASTGATVKAYSPSQKLADAEATLVALRSAVHEARANYEAVAAEHADEGIAQADGEVEKALRVALDKQAEANAALDKVMKAYGQRRYFGLVKSGTRRPAGAFALPSSIKNPSGDPYSLVVVADSIVADLNAALATRTKAK